MTEIRSLSFSYGKHKILDELSFSVGRGECVVLAGSNGTGKSTVLSLIAGVLRPDSGEIRTEGKIGYVPQGTALFEDMSAGYNLSFFAGLAGCEIPDELPFGLEKNLKMRVSRMSGGMKKQLSIACALLGEPELILFDEPCASLDIEYRQELTELICRLKSMGRSIIYVGHEPVEFAPFCDNIIFLGDGAESFPRSELAGEADDESMFCKNFEKIFKKFSKK